MRKDEEHGSDFTNVRQNYANSGPARTVVRKDEEQGAWVRFYKCETEFKQLIYKNCCERKRKTMEHGSDFKSVRQNSNS